MNPETLFIALANEAPDAPPALPGAEPLVGLPNSFEIVQDRYLVIPYGEAEKRKNGRTYLQRFTRQSAETMVSLFNSWRGKITRQFGGLPVYVGHPDSEEFANRDDDTKAYAWIMDLLAWPNGLALDTKWTEPGHVLIANAHYKWFSPHWYARKIAVENSIPVVEPVWLRSCGLTNSPNWPVEPLANQQEEGAMEFLQRIAAIIGCEAAEETVVSAVTHLVEAAQKIREAVEAKWDAEFAAREAIENDASPEDKAVAIINLVADKVTALANETEAKDAAQEKIGALTDKANAAKEAFANERKERIVLLVNAAVEDGRVLPADKDKWTEDLAADFDTKSAELANAAKAVKTQSKTGGLGTRNAGEQSKQDEILSLVNTKMEETGLSYNAAWQSVKRENPALFTEQGQED